MDSPKTFIVIVSSFTTYAASHPDAPIGSPPVHPHNVGSVSCKHLSTITHSLTW